MNETTTDTRPDTKAATHRVLRDAHVKAARAHRAAVVLIELGDPTDLTFAAVGEGTDVGWEFFAQLKLNTAWPAAITRDAHQSQAEYHEERAEYHDAWYQAEAYFAEQERAETNLRRWVVGPA